MERQKVIVGQKDTAKIVCPVCLKIKTVPAYNLLNRHKLRVICSCGKAFEVEVEFRNRYRRNTDLVGVFKKFRKKNDYIASGFHWSTTPADFIKPNCRIVNLSQNGLAIEALTPHDIKNNDFLQVTFRLDDPTETVIKKNLLVRYTKDNYIGCMLLKDDANDLRLQWYLVENEHNQHSLY